MKRQLIVIDQQTGEMRRVVVPERYPPPAPQYPEYEQYEPPQYPAPYQPQFPAQPPRNRLKMRKRERREKKARHISGTVPLVRLVVDPVWRFDHPGMTWIIWGAGFSFMLYKWLR